MLLGLWSGFWDWSGGDVPVVTKGGVADYTKYRKQLHAISKAAEKRLFNKIEKKIVKLAQNAPEPIAEVVEEIKSQIDFAKLSQEQSQEIAVLLNILLQKLDKLVNDALMLERQREEEEELILIMAAI